MAGREIIVITGSSGFIGRALSQALAERYDIIGLDVAKPKQAGPWREALAVDLTKDQSVDAAFAQIRQRYGERIAAVIHLAAYYDLTGDPDPRYRSVTVEGTARLLRALQGFAVGRFIFSSTMLVHAPCEPGQAIDEDWPIAPSWAYPQSKAETEALIRRRRGELPVAILRFAGVYDQMCRAAFLAQQIVRIYEQRPSSWLYAGDADVGQPYLHLDDLVDAVARVVERRRALPDVTTLLLGEPETPTYRELQERMGRLIHGEEWPTIELPKPLAKAGAWLQESVLDQDPFIKPWMVDEAQAHYALDIGRARELLGWEPHHRLVDTLPDMVAALKDDPPGWYAANKLDPHRVAADKVEPAPEPAGLAEAHEQRVAEAHRRTLWAPFANLALGSWLIFGPWALGLFDGADVAGLAPPPAAGHALAPPELRDALLGWSDIVSGVLICIFSALSLSRHHRWAVWPTALVGVWLLFAPLVVWAPSPVGLNNDLLVGTLVIVFAGLVPLQPGIAPEALASDADMPRGWSYSPSSYVQRVPIVVLAFIGLFISRYLTAYQLGHVTTVWDPFFGDGTRVVITSDVSKAWPVADAGVGLVSYVLEILAGIMGDRRRWRTMPWLVIMFGLLIVPLGGVSILFIIIQPIVIGTYCGLCLVAAAAMVIMIPFSLDELIATTQFLIRQKRAGRPFWRTFWRGGAEAGAAVEKRPTLADGLVPAIREFATGGVTYPWTLVAATALGIWLMLTPLLLGTQGWIAGGDHVVGCLVITISVTAMAEVARIVRFLNVPLGLWLIAAPFLFDGGNAAAMISDIVAGVAIVGLSLPRGPVGQEHYAGWDRAIV